jgi:hypothetical protein
MLQQPTPETNGQDVQMSQTQLVPINKHLNPSDLGIVLKIAYRLFSSSPVRTKRFYLADPQSSQAIQSFINQHRAKAELKETDKGKKWVITDKGLVDYMVVSYISQDQLTIEQNRLQ